MYIEALQKIIKDFVNMCGETFNTESNEIQNELDLINSKLERLEKKDKLTTSEKTDFDLLKVRKESWLNSASYLGNKVVSDFINDESKALVYETFNKLYEKVERSKDELTTSLIESKSENILDAINKLNIQHIKNKAKIIDESSKIYSNIYKHYQDKKSLTENVMKTLKEKKMIVDEILSLYQTIIKRISEEINKNNEDLLQFNEKKYIMAYALLKEEHYDEINSEINKLREIKLLNETELKKFNSEVEKVLKEKEVIEKELSGKETELEELEVELKEYKIKTENKEYISREKEIEHNIDLITEDLKIKKLDLQKDLLYIDLDKMKEMAISILNNPQKKNSLSSELEDEYSSEEIQRIESLMKKYEITKEEAIQSIEIMKMKENESKLVENYMEEFDLSEEEAQEALKNETGNKFWNIDEEVD